MTSISHYKLRCGGELFCWLKSRWYFHNKSPHSSALRKTFRHRIKNPFFPLNTSHEPGKLLTKLLLSPGKCWRGLGASSENFPTRDYYRLNPPTIKNRKWLAPVSAPGPASSRSRPSGKVFQIILLLSFIQVKRKIHTDSHLSAMFLQINFYRTLRIMRREIPATCGSQLLHLRLS